MAGLDYGRRGLYNVGMLRPRARRLAELTEVQAAWIGAVIDCEGSLIRTQLPGFVQIGYQVSNTDPEIMSALLRVTHAGSISTQEYPRNGHKLCLRWRIVNMTDVAALTSRILAYSFKAQTMLDRYPLLPRLPDLWPNGS